MPVMVQGRLKSVGWDGVCTLIHVRSSSIIVRTDERLVPGEVVEVEFRSSSGKVVSLTGIIDLNGEPGTWKVRLLERSENYRDFCDTLTLVHRS